MDWKGHWLLFSCTLVNAHMSLWYPGPLGGTNKSNSGSTYVDPVLNFPLGCCNSHGEPTLPSPGVCRGHLGLFGEEQAQVTWEPGQEAYFQLSDYAYTSNAPGSTHWGGSCQVGFSTDHGKSWRAVASYNGNCPHRAVGGSPEAQTFYFNVPTGMPQGKALFGWIWLNREHESFMNCAAVNISQRRVKTSHSRKTPASEHFEPSKTYVMTRYADLSAPWSRCNRDRLLNTDAPRSITSIISVESVASFQAETATGKICDWESAPPMIVSYYTVDAVCKPNAKMIYPSSDTFEVGWSAPCGNVEGDGEFPIELIDCY